MAFTAHAQQKQVTIGTGLFGQTEKHPGQRIANITMDAGMQRGKAMAKSPARMGVTQRKDLSKTERLVGYTTTDDMEITAYIGEAGTFSMGAFLTEQMLASYVGCRIIGVRFAVAKSIGRTRAFIYSAKNGGLVEEASQYQRTYEGWNTVMLNGEGVTIEAGVPIFFGFDYVETEAMAAAQDGALCLTGESTDGAFYAYGDFGQGLNLYSIDGGKLCVQLIVDISSLPAKDLDFTMLLSGAKYKQRGFKINALAAYDNVGRDSIFSYQLAYQFDDLQPVYYLCKDTIPDGKGDAWEINADIPDELSLGKHVFRVFVSEIEGEKPETHVNDTVEADFFLYDEAFMRQKIYMEIYNDQSSVYGALLNDVIAQMQQWMNEGMLSNQLIFTNNYKKGNKLAIADGQFLNDVYAYSYPTFTINRSYYPGEAYVAYEMNDYLSTGSTELCASILSSMIEEDINDPAFATINIHPEYNAATNMLSITLTGDVAEGIDDFFKEGLAATILLKEDNVTSTQVVYNFDTQRTSTNGKYSHNNVLRKFLTSPQGDRITVENGKYKIERVISLEKSWKPQNLSVVAFIANAVEEYTEENIYDINITNANDMSLADVIDTSYEMNTTDVTKLYNIIFGTDTTSSKAIWNIDGEGDVNTSDVTALYNIIFGTSK